MGRKISIVLIGLISLLMLASGDAFSEEEIKEFFINDVEGLSIDLSLKGVWEDSFWKKPQDATVFARVILVNNMNRLATVCSLQFRLIDKDGFKLTDMRLPRLRLNSLSYFRKELDENESVTFHEEYALTYRQFQETHAVQAEWIEQSQSDVAKLRRGFGC